MKIFLKQITATLVSLTIFSLVIIAIVSGPLLRNLKNHLPSPTLSQELKPNSLLHIKLCGEITSHQPHPFIPQCSHAAITYGLEQAKEDPKIKGLLIEVDPNFKAEPASLDSIGHELEKFQQSSKPVVIYSQSYGTSLLAAFSSADTILIHPTGTVSMQGPSISILYWKDLLDKFKIQPIVYQSGKNKNVGEPYTESNMRPATRNRLSALFATLYNYQIQTLEKKRGITQQQIEKINQTKGILTPYEAQSLGIVDQIGHIDDAEKKLNLSVQQKATKDTTPEAKANEQVAPSTKPKTALSSIDLAPYIKYKKEAEAKKNNPQIMICPLEGEIVEGTSSAKKIGTTDTIALLEKYAQDPNIKAIVITINSPGGSAIASESIRNTIDKTTKIKPVVCFMHHIGASGGYYIAMPSHFIIAQPITIVGSIGVASINFNVKKLLNKLGIHLGTINTSPFSNIGDNYHEPTKREKAIMQRHIKYMNQLFCGQLAAYRNLDPEKVAAFSDGQVFLAQTAQQYGLIDQIGYLHDAIDKAAELASLQPGQYTTTYHQDTPSIKDYIMYITRHTQSSTQLNINPNNLLEALQTKKSIQAYWPYTTTTKAAA